MRGKPVLTEKEKQILANQRDVALRHVRNVIEEIDPVEDVPDSGQVYMYIKKELLPNFYYYKYRFKSRARQMLFGARKAHGGGLMNSLKMDLMSQVKANRAKQNEKYDKSMAYFMHSAEHLREYHNRHEQPIYGQVRFGWGEHEPPPIEIASVAHRSIYNSAMSTQTEPLMGGPRWAEIMEIENEMDSTKRKPKPLELSPSSVAWKYQVPMKQTELHRGVTQPFKEAATQAKIKIQTPDHYDMGAKSQTLKTEELGEDNLIPHSGQAYMYIKKKEPPFYYRGRWQAMSRALLGDTSKRSRFNRAITKPTKPKPIVIPGVTDKGYNVAFYIESTEGTAAVPTKRWIIPNSTPGDKLPRVARKVPKEHTVDEGWVEIPRGVVRSPFEVAGKSVSQVGYVKGPTYDEARRPFETNRPIEYMPAETLDPDKDVKKVASKSAKGSRNDPGYFFKSTRGMEMEPYEKTARRRVPDVRTMSKRPQPYWSTRLPSAAEHSARETYMVQDPKSDIKKVRRWKAREFEHEYWRNAADIQTEMAQETLDPNLHVESVEPIMQKPSVKPDYEAMEIDSYDVGTMTTSHNRGLVKKLPPAQQAKAQQTEYHGKPALTSAQKDQVAAMESISPYKAVPDAGVVYMYERPRKPKAGDHDSKFIPRDKNKLFFSEWTAKKARLHQKNLKYDEAITRNTIDPDFHWREMYAHPLSNKKYPTYAIYGEDEDGLQELPFRADYPTHPEMPDNLTLKKVKSMEPDYYKQGANYDFDAPMNQEYLADENLDRDAIKKVTQQTATSDTYIGHPFYPPVPTEYKFTEDIIPDQRIASVTTGKYREGVDTDILPSAVLGVSQTVQGLADKTKPRAVPRDLVKGDGTPMYYYESANGRRIDAGETLDHKRNLGKVRLWKGRPIINEGPVDDAAAVLEYMNRATLDPKAELEPVSYLSTPESYNPFYMLPKYPIVADTMSRTPREYALWNTPKRVKQPKARMEDFDDPKVYDGAMVRYQLVEDVIDPTKDAKKIPQVPLYTDMFATFEDLDRGHQAYVDYRGRTYNRYSYRGYQDEFGDDDEAAFMDLYGDAFELPHTTTHMPLTEHKGYEKMKNLNKPHIEKYSEVYEGPLEPGKKTTYEQPNTRTVLEENEIPLSFVNNTSARRRASSLRPNAAGSGLPKDMLITDTPDSSEPTKIKYHRVNARPPLSTLNGPRELRQEGAWWMEKRSNDELARRFAQDSREFQNGHEKQKHGTKSSKTRVESQERLNKEKAAKEEKERLAREQDEREEKERLALEKKEKEAKERLVKEKQQREEEERLAREKAEREEQERLAKEAKEKEEQERLARENAEREEQERLAKEKQEREEQERLAKEKQGREEQDRLARETTEKEEQERLAREKAEKEEQERLAREKAEKEEQERLAREKAERVEQERLAREKAAREEQEKLAAEAALNEQLAKEQEEKERAHRIKQEEERRKLEELKSDLPQSITAVPIEEDEYENPLNYATATDIEPDDDAEQQRLVRIEKNKREFELKQQAEREEQERQAKEKAEREEVERSASEKAERANAEELRKHQEALRTDMPEGIQAVPVSDDEYDDPQNYYTSDENLPKVDELQKAKERAEQRSKEAENLSEMRRDLEDIRREAEESLDREKAQKEFEERRLAAHLAEENKRQQEALRSELPEGIHAVPVPDEDEDDLNFAQAPDHDQLVEERNIAIRDMRLKKKRKEDEEYENLYSSVEGVYVSLSSDTENTSKQAPAHESATLSDGAALSDGMVSSDEYEEVKQSPSEVSHSDKKKKKKKDKDKKEAESDAEAKHHEEFSAWTDAKQRDTEDSGVKKKKKKDKDVASESETEESPEKKKKKKKDKDKDKEPDESSKDEAAKSKKSKKNAGESDAETEADSAKSKKSKKHTGDNDTIVSDSDNEEAAEKKKKKDKDRKEAEAVASDMEDAKPKKSKKSTAENDAVVSDSDYEEAGEKKKKKKKDKDKKESEVAPSDVEEAKSKKSKKSTAGAESDDHESGTEEVKEKKSKKSKKKADESETDDDSKDKEKKKKKNKDKDKEKVDDSPDNTNNGAVDALLTPDKVQDGNLTQKASKIKDSSEVKAKRSLLS